MAYQRPKAELKLSKPEKLALLSEYVQYYEALAAADASVLNRKIERSAFAELLDLVGEVLVEESQRLATTAGPVRDFLQQTPLPPAMAHLLPDDFRAFCLALNALKQWLSAEQAATDRYLLGGTARQTLRSVASHCLVSGEPLERETLELHHPVRDGRPPLPVSKAGHAAIEGQVSSKGGSCSPLSKGSPLAVAPNQPANGWGDLLELLLDLKHAGNRSWVQLRRGCLDMLGRVANHSTDNVGAASRTFARKAAERTGLGYEQILALLDEKQLGHS